MSQANADLPTVRCDGPSAAVEQWQDRCPIRVLRLEHVGGRGRLESLTGIDGGTLWCMEVGRKGVGLVRLRRLAEVFGVSLGSLDRMLLAWYSQRPTE